MGLLLFNFTKDLLSAVEVWYMEVIGGCTEDAVAGVV